VINISWKATEADIRDFVSTFAQVKDVKLLRDELGRSKGTNIPNTILFDFPNNIKWIYYFLAYFWILNNKELPMWNWLMRNNCNWLYQKKVVSSKDVKLNSKKLVPVSPNQKRKRKKELIDLKEVKDLEELEEENHSSHKNKREIDKSIEKEVIIPFS
jgi:hypothetical protein